MTKAEKIQLVENLTEQFKEYPNFYIADTKGMSVSDMNDLRRLCFEKNVKLQMIKNTLIRKALENLEEDFTGVFDSLKQTSSVFFVGADAPSAPAKILKEYRKSSEKPLLKAAVIEASVFSGDDQIEALANLKSKDELIGDVIMLLQSPAKNVIGALQSGGSKLSGILKTLSEREG